MELVTLTRRPGAPWRPSLDEPGTRRVGAFAALPAVIARFGVDPASLLEEARLAPSVLAHPQKRIEWESLARLLRLAAERTNCPHFGLEAGRAWRLADLGLVGDLMQNSPTVGDALRQLVVHQHLNSEGALAFMQRQDDAVDLGYAVYVPFAESTKAIYDVALVVAVNIMRELCGEDWSPSEVLLPYSAPLDIAPYQQRFGARLQFDAPLCAIQFNGRWLAATVPGADSRRLRRPHGQASAERGALLDQVHRAVRTLLLHRNVSGADLAQVLAMHRRTLNRRLKAEGATFQEALDRVRLAMAKEFLRDSDLPLSEIADALGYAHSTAFLTAFRRWTRTTPGGWRKAERGPRA